MKEFIIEAIENGFRLKNRFVRHDVTARSAQMTYYFILSIFPLLITVISIVSYINISQAEMMAFIEPLLPSSIMPFVENTLQKVVEYRSATLLWAGAIASIWSASAGVTAMMRGIYRAYNAIDLRPYVVRKAISVFYTAILTVMIAAMIVLLIYGNNIGRWFFYNFMPEQAFKYMPIWDNIRLTTPIIGLFIGFYVIYKFIPRKHVRYGCVWPGTVFTTVTWYIFSIGFSIYTDNYAKYNQMYGSIGSIFILLIWLYVSSILLLLGAEINAFYQDLQTAKKRNRR